MSGKLTYRERLRRLGCWAPSRAFGDGWRPGGGRCCKQFAGSSFGSSGSEVAPTYDTVEAECGPCDIGPPFESTTPRYLQVEFSAGGDDCTAGCAPPSAPCSDLAGTFTLEYRGGLIIESVPLNYCYYGDAGADTPLLLAENVCLKAQGDPPHLNPAVCENVFMGAIFRKFPDGGGGLHPGLSVGVGSTEGCAYYHEFSNSFTIWDGSDSRCVGNPKFEAEFPKAIPITYDGGEACVWPGSVLVSLVPE